jgi:prepilin-type processing-associated H-X9-DG protein
LLPRYRQHRLLFRTALAAAVLTDTVPEDRYHLNGLAMVDGQPRYVTALGETDTVGGWRPDKATGVVLDVETGAVVVRGLAMPHSPRYALPPDFLQVVAGNSFVDQAAITGESLPVEKLAGSRVYAGTINQSRRGIRGSGLADYNYIQQDSAVLFGAPSGISLETITNCNGTAYTALIAHVGGNPRDYQNGPTAWYCCIQPTSALSIPDSQVPQGQIPGQTFGSPHPSVNVVLFADGHVQSLPHQWLTANHAIWSWQNTTPIQFP